MCPQYEALAHELFLRPIVEKDAPVVGTLVHVGLAYRYGMMLPQRPEWLVYPEGRTAIWTCGQNRPELAAVALNVFDAYERYYNINTWIPVLVEHQFEILLADEPYTCRLDMLAIEDGDYVLVDHKAKGYIRRETGYEYRADRQMLTQLALARFYGYDVKRVIINAIKRPRPNKLGFYDLDNFRHSFARFPVPISQIAFGRLWEDTAWALRNMKAVRQQYPDPMNRPRNWDSCIRVYGPCDFMPICTEGPERLHDFTKRS